MNLPLVSIIVPTFNRADLIGETLESVAAQTYQNWECIIVDDGSTDDTKSVVLKYSENDPRFIWEPRPSEEPPGGSSCRNHGLALSSGEYLIFLDSDDLLMPSCLESRVEYVKNHPELDFATFQAEAFTEHPGDLGVAFSSSSAEPDLDRFLHLNHVWQTTGPIWRKQSLEDVGGWDADLPSWQDWELNLRALCRGLNYEKINDCDFYFRRSPSEKRVNSRQRHDIVHLSAAIPLFRKVSRQLIESNKMNVGRSRSITGLTFIVAMRLLWDHGLYASLVSWRRAFSIGLLRFSDYAIGTVVLTSVAPKWVRRLTRPTLLAMYRKRIGWTHKRIIL